MSYLNRNIIFKTTVSLLFCPSYIATKIFNFLSAGARSAKNSLRSALQAGFQNFCAPRSCAPTKGIALRSAERGAQNRSASAQLWKTRTIR